MAGGPGKQLVIKAVLDRKTLQEGRGQATLDADKQTAGGSEMCVIAEPARPWALMIPLGPQARTNRFTAMADHI